MNGIIVGLAALVLAIVAATFLVGFIRTLLEGPEVFDDFNRAGFTLRAFIMGRVPKSNAGSSLRFGESAEISVVDGKIKAETTRTIAKTHS